MDIFFVFLRFIKELFTKDSEVQYLDATNVNAKITSFTVKIRTNINLFDESIVTRYYEILGLMSERQVLVYMSWRTNYAVRKISKNITDIIELHSGKKIKPKNLHKAIKSQYNGRVLIDGITIDFKQS